MRYEDLMVKTKIRKSLHVAHSAEESTAAAKLAYDYLNAGLFANVLPPCQIVLLYDYCAAGKFIAPPLRGMPGSRIVLHRQFFETVHREPAMQVLVHQMLHLWQFHFGLPTPEMAHNEEFAKLAISIGLMPTATSGKFGAKVGDHVIDYVVPGGPFERHVRAMDSKRECAGEVLHSNKSRRAVGEPAPLDPRDEKHCHRRRR